MKKILIVEDDIYLRDMYEDVLEKNGYTIDTADDGEQALQVKPEQFDLILLDILLPKMNGIELIKELRKENAPTVNTPIILITNLGEDRIIDEAFRLGADAYILKAQVKPDELVQKIHDFFNERASK